MTRNGILLSISLVLVPAVLAGQGRGVDPSELLKPLADSWLTHSGDYSGRRYSALKQIDRTTVKNLTLAWVAPLTDGPGNMGPFGFGGGRGPVIVGGEGTGEFFGGGGTTIKASALMVDGTIYISTPDNAWALDARDGRERWHYDW
jgi:alcohol dehydrogenase (cytochrome c)